MDRFRAAFASLLLVAAVTTALAGLGLVSTFVPFASGTSGGESTTTTMSTTATSTATTTQSTVSSSTTTETTVASTTTTTTFNGAGGLTYSPAGPTQGQVLLRQVEATSLFLAPVCWVLLGGAWIWRGRMRARWTELGFGSDVFDLFMKMKGGGTRIRVLNTLSSPKDRLQLAEELGVDWKTVDRHVQILNKYGFVREQAAYGTVKLYEVTPIGKMLLNLFDDLEKTDGPVVPQDKSVRDGRSEKNF